MDAASVTECRYESVELCTAIYSLCVWYESAVSVKGIILSNFVSYPLDILHY